MRGESSTNAGFWRVHLAALLIAAPPLAAQQTAFTYQGQLDVSGTQAVSYDFQADVFAQECSAEPCTGTPLNPAPLLFPGVALTQGRFLLSIDPGAEVFTGPERFLQLRVRRAGESSFTTLLPRQKITAAPYAQHAADADFAATVAPGSVGTTQLAAGAVGTAQVDANQVQRRITGACVAPQSIRQIAQDGSVSCVSPAVTSWNLSGNAGTSASYFLGTTDAQPLQLRVNNRRVARFEVLGLDTNVLMGIADNVIDAGVRGATIGGGGSNTNSRINRVTDDYGTVGGGQDNVAGDSSGTTTDAINATVSGGSANTASGTNSTVGGGSSNTASGSRGTIGGGGFNTASGESSTVGGGSSNRASGSYSHVGGGNTNYAIGQYSTVGGGYENVALGLRSTVSGGQHNCAGGNYSWAGGRFAKVRPPAGTGADPDGWGCDNVENAPGADGDNGTFVWADSQSSSFVSTGSDQFNIRAQGGVNLHDSTSLFFGVNNHRQRLNFMGTQYGIGTQAQSQYFRSASHFRWFRGGTHSTTGGDPGTGGVQVMQLIYNATNNVGNLSVTGSVTATAFNTSSDRTLKTDIAPVDTRDVLARVLALPIAQWRYTNDADKRHLGPMAQDFHAAFGLNGEDDTHIATVDADGVALAAIQGLHAELSALRERVEALESENRGLRRDAGTPR